MSFLNNILPKNQVKEYFLTVGIEESRIHATVSLITGKEVTIIGTGISEFSQAGQETEAADIAISEAEKKIGEDVLVQKVIFGLPVSLLEKDQIKPQHLTCLKKITKTLSLVPCGFIEYPQALSYYLETKEESPPTLLILSIGKKQVTFSHIRVGKIEKNIVIEKTSSFTSDFAKALVEFSSSEILPSRIILYDESGDAVLDEIREELLRFPWHKHSSFLHTPKIETLETSALTYALVEAAAKSLAKELHFEDKESTNAAEKERAEIKEETFGFVRGKDVTQETEKLIDKQQEKQGDESNIKETETVQAADKSFREEENPVENFSFPQKDTFLAKLPKLQFSFPKLSFAKTPVIALGITGILVLVFLLFVFWYYPKAKVNLIVYPASSSSQIEVLFASNADNIKPGKNNILTTSASEEVSGDKTTTTTGKIKIGEKANGTVTIYNKTLSGKNFPKGSVLITDNLKFTLDDDTTVASASDTGEGLIFGKMTSKIQASEIGPEGNLAAGTNFTFRDFGQSLYYAKNNDKLSGGTSRDITSVSKEDQDKLLVSLTDELTALAKQQMRQKINPGEKLLEVSIDNSVTAKKFSKGPGEETKELSLSLTLKATGLVYKEKDLTDLTHTSLTQTPSGFTLASEKTSIRINEAKTNSKGDVVAQATIIYYFFPQIDIGKISSEVAGKTFAQVDKYLSTVQNIGGVEIIADTRFPLFTNRLPLRMENINITLISH